MLFVAILQRRYSPGPLFYQQERSGRALRWAFRFGECPHRGNAGGLTRFLETDCNVAEVTEPPAGLLLEAASEQGEDLGGGLQRDESEVGFRFQDLARYSW